MYVAAVRSVKGDEEEVYTDVAAGYHGSASAVVCERSFPGKKTNILDHV